MKMILFLNLYFQLVAYQMCIRDRYSVGGVMEFLECEDNEFLLSFYTQNHFKPFDTRITASQNNEPIFTCRSNRSSIFFS